MQVFLLFQIGLSVALLIYLVIRLLLPVIGDAFSNLASEPSSVAREPSSVARVGTVLTGYLALSFLNLGIFWLAGFL